MAQSWEGTSPIKLKIKPTVKMIFDPKVGPEGAGSLTNMMNIKIIFNSALIKREIIYEKS